MNRKLVLSKTLNKLRKPGKNFKIPLATLGIYLKKIFLTTNSRQQLLLILFTEIRETAAVRMDDEREEE